MANLFEDNRSYVLGDPELEIFGDRQKLAQWRHKRMGPAFYHLGRKIIYRGADFLDSNSSAMSPPESWTVTEATI